MRHWTVVLLLCLSMTAGRTTQEKEATHKAIRMKTSRQLKEIFDELGISHKGLDKEGLRKKAYKEDAIAKWEKLHPEKKPKPRPAGGSAKGAFDDIPGFNDDPKMQEMLRQMRGDFSGEKDPERRRLLEKLAKKGMSFGGGSSMDTEQLRQMEKMMDGLGDMGKGGGPGMGSTGVQQEEWREGGEEEVADEDKIEL